MLKTYKKGQLFSTDLFISASIFLVLIISIIAVLTLYSVRFDETIKNEDIVLRALQITDILLKSEGEPYDWENNPGDVNVFGLVTSDRMFSTSKVREFVKLNENDVRDKLNVENVNFYFSLKDPQGALYAVGSGEFSEAGSKPSLEAKNVVAIQRIGVYSGQDAFMEFILWE